MINKTIVACAVTFAVGVSVGFLLTHSERNEEPESISSARDSKKLTARSNQPARASRRKSYQKTPRKIASTSSDLITVPRRLLEELSLAAGNRTAGQPLFSSDRKLEALLQIVGSERATVEKAWKNSLQKTREMEAESATSEDLTDGSVRITIPDLGSDIASIGAEFKSTVCNILGPERGEVFLALNQADSLFTPPKGDRTYTVKSEAIGDGRWRFHMTLEGSLGRRVWVGNSIPDEIRHLTDAANIRSSQEGLSQNDDK
ncbi:hypothetical protein JO972_08795 [Verrucomicrobiaceae bacterium 5K15]|uniref:Uncharacterized protein n=1 Tax=Oceaniferula flava TaxID=2800421 RepID=A0AAE2SDT8_9BACT|nr:hypothetical protein [Oceaniferula flavus]MBK1855054.1 hypothetical protein [Oceaniferula flavus]MBM1136360.1 hypothetical protein [Oceaniferula flavus]